MADKKYQYCVAECWGSGFITTDDATKFSISGFPGNVWQVPANNRDANIWINGVAGIRKTVEEAQAIVTEQVQIAQAAWDALPADDFRKKQNARPNDIVLPE
jgi:hypothetical protein